MMAKIIAELGTDVAAAIAAAVSITECQLTDTDLLPPPLPPIRTGADGSSAEELERIADALRAATNGRLAPVCEAEPSGG